MVETSWSRMNYNLELEEFHSCIAKFHGGRGKGGESIRKRNQGKLSGDGEFELILERGVDFWM